MTNNINFFQSFPLNVQYNLLRLYNSENIPLQFRNNFQPMNYNLFSSSNLFYPNNTTSFNAFTPIQFQAQSQPNFLFNNYNQGLNSNGLNSNCLNLFSNPINNPWISYK